MIQQVIIDNLRAFSNDKNETELQIKIPNKRSLERVKNHLYEFFFKSTKQTDYIQRKTEKTVIRKSVIVPDNPSDDLQVIWIEKTKLYDIDVDDYSFRFSISDEKDIKPKKNFKYSVQRDKDRLTYKISDFIIDITIVEQMEGDTHKSMYELEVEFPKDLSDETFKTFNNFFTPLWCIINDTIEPYTVFEKEMVKMSIENLKMIIKPKYLQPHHLTLDLIQNSYRASMKIDGTRKWLVMNQIGIWLALPFVNEFSLVQKLDLYRDFTPFVLDGEITNDGVYHIFDLLSFDSIEQSNVEHTVRMQKIQNLLADFDFDTKVELRTLSFVTLTYDNIFDVLQVYTNKNLSPEGMVLVPNRTDLYQCLKWKHDDLHTIDVRIFKHLNDYVLFGHDHEKNIDVKFETDLKLIDPENILEHIDYYNIVELLITDKGLQVYRIRYDKVIPNSLETISAAIQLCNEPITSDDLSGKSMFYVDLYRNHLISQIDNSQIVYRYKDRANTDTVILTDDFKDVFEINKFEKKFKNKNIAAVIIDRDRIKQCLDPKFYGFVFKEIDFDIYNQHKINRVKFTKNTTDIYISMSELIEHFGSPNEKSFKIPNILLSPMQKIFVQFFSVAYFTPNNNHDLTLHNPVEN